MSNYFENNRLYSEKLKALIPIFAEEIRQDFLEAQRYLSILNAESCSSVLHKMKGSAVSYGVDELVVIIQRLRSEIIAEQHVRCQISMDRIGVIVSALVEESKKYEA